MIGIGGWGVSVDDGKLLAPEGRSGGCRPSSEGYVTVGCRRVLDAVAARRVVVRTFGVVFGWG